MKGLVLSEPTDFTCDKNLLEFRLGLPQPTKHKNVIRVLIRKDYEYIPSKDEEVEISGNLVSFDLGAREGVQLFLSTVVVYPLEGGILPKDNTIRIRGTIHTMNPVTYKDSGKIIVRFSVLPDGLIHNKIPVYCVLEGPAAEQVATHGAKQVIVVQGRLITRRYTYKSIRRETTELYVSNCSFPNTNKSEEDIV